MAFVLIFTLAVCKRQKALYYSLMLHLTCFIVIFFKLYFHGPRPYQHSREIDVYGFSTEYGDPSGHTLSASAIYTTYILDVWTEMKSEKKTSLLVRLLMVGVSLLLTIMVGFSRVFTGQHSLD